MAEPLVCSDCGENYVMSASEKVRFQELMKTVQGFQMPKRCPECRKRRRIEKVAETRQEPSSSMSVSPQARVSVMVTAPPAEPEEIEPGIEAVESAKEEVRFILATKDFEDLVHGRPVVWQGVRVLLADIGFKVMRDAIERAETERAKLLYHKNGAP